MDGRLWIFHGVMIFALYTAAKAAGRVEGAQQEKNRQKRPGRKRGGRRILQKPARRRTRRSRFSGRWKT